MEVRTLWASGPAPEPIRALLVAIFVDSYIGSSVMNTTTHAYKCLHGYFVFNKLQCYFS